MRLLVTTFSLCPDHGSEPGVGWHMVEELAREHEVHALVDKNWEPTVGRVFHPQDHPHIHLHFIGIPLLTRLTEGPMNNGPCWAIYYYLWQIAAWLAARRLHRQHQFQACQHVTFVKFNTPSFLHLLGIPFLWGPVGGAEKAPSSFYCEFGFKIRLVEAVRVLAQKAALIDPFIHACTRRSHVAYAVTQETAVELRKLGAGKVEIISAVALSDEELLQLAPPAPAARDESNLTLLYVGRLIAWKGVHLALRALARGPATLRLRIIGDGPLRTFLEAEACSLGLANRVEFTGDLPRPQVLAAYAVADGFLYPSVHDSGGNAVLEAMASSLPVICLAYGGPDLIVSADCGWKVSAATPEQAVAGLSQALRDLAADPVERRNRGAAARARCLAEFSWSRRGEQWRAKYSELAS